jgi:hypothetical protein
MMEAVCFYETSVNLAILHVVTPKKLVLFILVAVRTWNPTTASSRSACSTHGGDDKDINWKTKVQTEAADKRAPTTRNRGILTISGLDVVLVLQRSVVTAGENKPVDAASLNDQMSQTDKL